MNGPTPAYPTAEELLARGASFGERLVTAFGAKDYQAGLAVCREIDWADEIIGECAYGCATWKVLAFTAVKEFERIGQHERPAGTVLGPLVPADARPEVVAAATLAMRAVMAVMNDTIEDELPAIVDELHSSGSFNGAILAALAKLVWLARTEANRLDAVAFS